MTFFTTTPRARLLSAGTIFLVALALRVAAASVLGDLPISRTPQLDSAAYVSWARALVANPAFWPAYPEHAPGYPLFIASVLGILGGSLMAVRVVQAVLGAIGCVLTARVAARTLTPGAFLPAGLLQAVYAPLVYIDTALLAESLLIFLLMLLLDRTTSARAPKHWLLAGLILGLAIVVRPTALVLFPAFAIVIALREPRPAALRHAAALLAGTFLITLPAVAQNWRVTGVPLVQAYGGMNLYLGNRPSGSGMASARLGGEWDSLEGEASRAGVARNDQDAYYVRQTLDEIADRPGQYAALLGSKLVWAFQDEELRDTHSYYFFEGSLPWLGWLPGFGVAAALAVIGLWSAFAQARTDRSGVWWLAAYLGAMLVSVVFLVVGTRYRMPIVPAVIAFAGAGAAFAVDRVRARDWRSVGVLAIVFLVALAGVNARTHAASRNPAEEYALTGLSLLQENNTAGAEATVRAAIGMDDSSFAWDVLGMVLLRRELRRDALDAFQRAIQLNERNATAWVHLGLAHEFLGNGRAAVAAYQKALSITPQRAEALAALDAALKRYAR